MTYSLNRGIKFEKNEIIVSHINIRQSISILILKLLLVDLITGAIVGFSYFSYNLTDVGLFLGMGANVISYFIFLAAALIKISFSIYIILDWLNEYYELTPKHIIYRHGIIFTKQETINFSDVRKIRLNQGLLGKILNFGTIEMYDFLMKKTLDAYLIHNPLRYEKILLDLIPEVEEEKDIIREKMFSES